MKKSNGQKPTAMPRRTMATSAKPQSRGAEASDRDSQLALSPRLNRCDAHARRELRKLMRNAIERILGAGRGDPLPPKYEPNFDMDD